MLSQCLNERDTQSPDVPRGADLSILQLRRIMQRRTQDSARQPAHRANRIAGQLNLITNHQQVGWLHLALYELVSMQEVERTQCRYEHLPRFVGSQRTPGQELGQRLIGIFHNDVQIHPATDMAPTNVEDANQVGMVQGSGRTPLYELSLGFQRIGWNELDGGLGDSFGSVFSEKYVAVVGSAEKTSQRIGAIDYLVFPPDPDFGLGDSLRFCAHERQPAPKVGMKISPTADLVGYNIHTVSEPRDKTRRSATGITKRRHTVTSRSAPPGS